MDNHFEKAYQKATKQCLIEEKKALSEDDLMAILQKYFIPRSLVKSVVDSFKSEDCGNKICAHWDEGCAKVHENTTANNISKALCL